MSVHLKLLIASLFWGATPTVGRMLAPYEAPLAVVCGRFIVAAVFLLWFVYAAGQFVRIPRRYWPRFVLLGVTGIVLHNGLMYKGLEFTTATTTSIILALIAIQVVILDWILYRRRPAALALGGVVVAFVGTIYVISGGRLDALGSIGLGLGEVLAFLSALAWAFYSVLGRDLLNEYSALVVTTYATLIGVVFMSPFLFERPEVTLAIYSNLTAVGLIFLLGFVGTALGFLWYYEAVIEMGTVGAAIYINLVPVFGVLTAAVVLGEPLDGVIVIGGLLVMTGVLLVNWPGRAASTRDPA